MTDVTHENKLQGVAIAPAFRQERCARNRLLQGCVRSRGVVPHRQRRRRGSCSAVGWRGPILGRRRVSTAPEFQPGISRRWLRADGDGCGGSRCGLQTGCHSGGKGSLVRRRSIWMAPRTGRRSVRASLGDWQADVRRAERVNMRRFHRSDVMQQAAYAPGCRLYQH
jgi:hypothetical protein